MRQPDKKYTTEIAAKEVSLRLLEEERTARAEAEARSKSLYNLLMQAPAAICLLRGPQHTYEFANPLYLQLIGRQDILGKSVREVLPELEGQEIFELLDRVYTTGNPFIGNELQVKLDGPQHGQSVERYFNFVYQPSYHSDGTIDGILVHAVDVTEQVRQRQKAQESEARLWRLVNSNIIGVSFTNLKGAIIDTNESFLRMLGYTREDIAANKLNWQAITPPEYAALDSKALEEIRRNGAVSHPYEKEYIARDGSRIPVLVGGASLRAAGDEIVTFVVDIRQQKQMERELRKANEQLEAILYNAGDGITVHDVKGNMLYANNVAALMCGFSSAEAMLTASTEDYRQMLNRFVVKDEAGAILTPGNFPGRQALRTGKSVQMLLQYHDRLTDRTAWTLIKSQPIFIESGQAQFAVNVLVDMSERQELEERKNEFISMASHELKTPVTSLKGFTHLLQRHSAKQDDEQALHYLSRIEAQLNKLVKLINDLLDISKMQAGKLDFQEEVVDLTALMREIVENIQGTTSTHQIVAREIGDIRVVGDKDRLGQVLINLLTNAIKYSPQANRVLLQTVTNGQQVTVSVQDFGIGIAETYHHHIFERFYQVTDPQEKTYPGLGIGLYIVHEIIRRHQGNIWVESRKGQGATFFFTLPLADEREK